MSGDYERLRSWYLARLRKSAHDAERQRSLTPASLIAADRAAIERLIADKARESEAVIRHSRKLIDRQFGMVWSVLLISLALLVFASENFEVQRTLSIIYRLSVGVLLAEGPFSVLDGGAPAYYLLITAAVFLVPLVWIAIRTGD
jgi:uncharacterized membrane protein